MKILTKILLLLGIILLLASSMMYDAYYAAPKRITPRYVTLSSESIPAQLDEVTILFFSDLNYHHFFNRQRLGLLVEKINALSPDVVIFGGDLFDQRPGKLDDAVQNELAEGLRSIKAPLGKFAVLGDFDHLTTSRRKVVENVLYDADFELLNNTSVMLRNTGSQSVTLIGIDSGLRGNPNISSAYANISRNSYTITVCHTPDTADQVPADLTDYFLAGHSLGGQVFYGFGSLYAPEMAVNYLRGRHTINASFTLDITSGVGTTEEDIRFLSNAEVVLYRLRSETPAGEEQP